MSICKICGNQTIKKGANACSGSCSAEYHKVKQELYDNRLNREMAKEVNAGFVYDEPSCLL